MRQTGEGGRGDRDSLEGWVGFFPSSDVWILTDGVLTLRKMKVSLIFT